MKLHGTLVEKLVQLFTTYGGWQGEKRLKEELGKLNVAVYKQQSTGKEIVVDADLLEKLVNEMPDRNV